MIGCAELELTPEIEELIKGRYVQAGKNNQDIGE